jgi:hypothetical protein
MSQLEEASSRSWSAVWKDSFTVRPEEGPQKWVKIKSCAELSKIDVKATKTRPDDAWEYMAVRAGWCRALEVIKRASPAKESFLKDVLSAKNPAPYIPASVVDVVNAGEEAKSDPDVEASKKAHASVSWAKHDPALKLADAQAKDRIEFEGKDYVASVSYYAAGDFNGDGIEDVLVQISIRSFDASQGDGAFFILTRDKPKGLLTVIETFR